MKNDALGSGKNSAIHILDTVKHMPEELKNGILGNVIIAAKKHEEVAENYRSAMNDQIKPIIDANSNDTFCTLFKSQTTASYLSCLMHDYPEDEGNYSVEALNLLVTGAVLIANQEKELEDQTESPEEKQPEFFLRPISADFDLYKKNQTGKSKSNLILQFLSNSGFAFGNKPCYFTNRFHKTPYGNITDMIAIMQAKEKQATLVIGPNKIEITGGSAYTGVPVALLPQQPQITPRSR